MYRSRFFIAVILFFSPFFNHGWAANDQSWKFAMVSEDITKKSADKDSIDNVKKYFAEKEIILKENMLYVKGLFSCRVVDEKETPVSYWQSVKTVSFYRDFLKQYGIQLDENIDVITPVDPNSQCQLPFSEFIITDNTLMLIYKNRAVWYYPDGDVRLKQVKNQEKVQESISTTDSVSCIEGSNEMDVVYTEGNIVTCVYPNTDLLSAYLKFREKHKTDEVLNQLKKSITPGKNEIITILSDLIFKYNWKSNNELDVDILQSGGETRLNFRQTNEGTTVKNISLPD
ncbi:hypothetical protein EC843_10615 [Buttiauxella sp. JUb87]|uniref:hypothetical protein n=1 Tax=Buttiauxella sp. JUb87 TaxID=2485129 RepID=UPI0010610664|nr:hypothetical protein [Buttiauxella sp. JUb87]TDN50098.1 hypothetical protein EC843_10615 [Buttiauxella sp. JUb87]